MIEDNVMLFLNFYQKSIYMSNICAFLRNTLNNIQGVSNNISQTAVRDSSSNNKMKSSYEHSPLMLRC